MATRKSARKSSATGSGKRSTTPPSRRWSAKVKTDSTKPAPGLFKKTAREIASGLSKGSVSPEGPGQAMRMLSFYENRGGKNLPAERKRALEGAKDLLREREGKGPAKKGAKSAAKKSSKAARAGKSSAGGSSAARLSVRKSGTKRAAAKKISAKKAGSAGTRAPRASRKSTASKRGSSR